HAEGCSDSRDSNSTYEEPWQPGSQSQDTKHGYFIDTITKTTWGWRVKKIEREREREGEIRESKERIEKYTETRRGKQDRKRREEKVQKVMKAREITHTHTQTHTHTHTHSPVMHASCGDTPISRL